jgi:hypothetical protein
LGLDITELADYVEKKKEVIITLLDDEASEYFEDLLAYRWSVPYEDLSMYCTDFDWDFLCWIDDVETLEDFRVMHSKL